MTAEPSTKAPRRQRSHVLAQTPILLVRPSYPENVGAVARAMRVTGFHQLVLVDPGPLAHPEHEQARKLAVGSLDLLDASLKVPSLEQALTGYDCVVGTSARPGQKGVMTVRQAAPLLVQRALQGERLALVFGGERTGLHREELERCQVRLRIPMVCSEPSLNLAQAAMVILYELLVAALEASGPGTKHAEQHREAVEGDRDGHAEKEEKP